MHEFHARKRSAPRPVRSTGERGAAMVELAIVLPVLVILLLGIVSTAVVYNQKLSLTNGAREGARYAATLPVGNFANVNAWLDSVAGVSATAVDDGFGAGVPGRITCVAYVYPQGITTDDRTTRRRESGGVVSYSNQTCYTDGRPSTERRVQIILQRDASISTGFVKIPIAMTSRSVARFESAVG
jgi:hypothetical protein